MVISKTTPLTIGLFAIMLTQLIDSIFIGILGIDALTAHGVTLPFQVALVGIQVGIGVGATAIMSQAIGANKRNSARATATISLVFGALFISVVCVILWALEDSIFRAFIPSETSPYQYQILLNLFHCYWPIWLFSAISIAGLYLVSCIFRANGDTQTTGMTFVIASILNLMLDPVLMFTFELGITGAAMASSIGFSCGFIYMLIKAIRQHWLFPIKQIKNAAKHLTALLTMIVPTTLNQMLPSFSALIATLLIAQMGTDVLAFWSIFSRIESFILVFTLALTMSIPPMISRFLGANKLDDISHLLKATAKLLLILHLGIAILLAATADILIPMVNNETQMKAWLEIALWIMPLSYGPLGLCILTVSALNALLEPRSALKLVFLRLLVLYIPAIWLGSSTGSVAYTLVAAMAANILAGIFAWYRLKAHLNAPRQFHSRVHSTIIKSYS